MNVESMNKIVGHYRYALSGVAGEAVMNDLAIKVGLVPDPDKLKTEHSLTHYAGDQMTHAECMYRNGAQDLFRYIEALASQQ